MTDHLLFFVITIVDISAATIIFAGALSEKMRTYPLWHKVGLMVAALGLVAQGFRNVIFLATGVSPSDADLPLWILKDCGIAIIAYLYAYRGYMMHKASKVVAQVPVKAPYKRKPARKKVLKKDAKTSV